MSLIRNEARARQPVDFSGIGESPKNPSDVDLIYDDGDKGYFISEIKTKNNPLSIGQKILLQRLYNDLCGTGKSVLLVVAVHNTPPEQTVKAADCIVVSYYLSGAWHEAKNGYTLKQAFDHWMKGK